jgi:hypothetical protein
MCSLKFNQKEKIMAITGKPYYKIVPYENYEKNGKEKVDRLYLYLKATGLYKKRYETKQEAEKDFELHIHDKENFYICESTPITGLLI